MSEVLAMILTHLSLNSPSPNTLEAQCVIWISTIYTSRPQWM